MSEETIFSKIIRQEIPAKLLYQDELVSAFRDIGPKAPTHILIVPNKVIPTVNQVTAEDELALGRLFTVARKLAEEEGIAADGYRLRWHNEIIYYCEYIEDGLTKSGHKKYLDSFQGFTMYVQQIVGLYDFTDRLKAVSYYDKLARMKGMSMSEVSSNLQISKAEVIVARIIRTGFEIVTGNFNRE